MSASLGRLALSTVGIVAGSILIPGPLGAGIGLAIGTGLGFLLFPPEGKTIEGPRLDDLKVTFSSYGKPIPRIYGRMETGGNIAWSPGLVEHRVKEDVGGKGAPSVTQITFLYTASFRIIYADASPNPAQAILRNWTDGELIRDNTVAGATQNFFDTSGPGDQAVRDFLGESTQLPGPAEQADKGIDDTPAYRFLVSQEWEDLPLEDFGNRIPQMTAEVAMSADEAFPFTTAVPLLTIISENSKYSQDLGIAYSLSVNFAEAQRISFSSQSFIDVISYASSTNIIELDELDRVWGWNNLGADDVDFQLYEGSTGRLISKSPVGVVWDDGVLAFNLMLLRGGRGGAIAVGFSGRLIQLGPGGEGVDIIHVRDHNDTYELSTYFAGSYSVVGGNYSTIDGDGDPWLTIDEGVNGNLIHFDGVSGDPIERFSFASQLITHITYDRDTNSLIIENKAAGLFKFSLDTKTVTSTLVHTLVAGNRNNTAWQVIDGKMYVQQASTGTMAIFDVSGDDIIDLGDLSPLTWVGGIRNWEAPLYDPISHALIVTRTTGSPADREHAWLFLDRVAPNDITVQSIVEDVSLLVDYSGGDIDASALTDTLPGYIVKSRMTARKALEPLATAFNFRSVESDHQIKFPKRGGASVGNIPQIDLGATAGETPTTQALIKTRIPEDQLFETAIIEYIDPTFDNNPNTQQAKRIKEAIDVGGSIIFNFPGSLGNDQAKQIIERILFQAWSGRTKITTPIPLKHILKDPGDVVTITKDGKTVQVELHDVRLGANSVIKIEGTIDDSVVHVSTATGADALGVEGQVIVLSGPTEFFILDIPLLRDVDDAPGIYVGAGTPTSVPWSGAQIFRGLDAISLAPFTGIVSTRNLNYGSATTVLADAEANIWDRTNSVTLTLVSGTLSSDTETNVLNGANTLLIGDEVIQFTTAVLNADGSYTISILLRGRVGTDYATGTHVLNERVVVISTSTLLRVDVNLSEHLSTFFYRAITLGSSQFSSRLIERVLNLRSLMPLAPSHIAGTIAADDWTFTLVRRGRIGGSWRSFTGVPLGETSEAYEWDVMDGVTVVRTLTSSTGSVIYTSAQQTTDFGGNRTTVELNVYQISGEVGRGFVSNVTLVGG